MGETSVLLAQLQAAATDDVRAHEVALLRREAEDTPPAALGTVAARALRVADTLCRDSLDRGDAQAFSRQCACAADLLQFCTCAQLIHEG
ncbi:hypothetical protein GXW82_33085 [Streptacidiphilus sp. 4-A2]|nr:hypothetical protein [Streptacidiphilus sp. 4-A2]